jgi:hypothetical protein
MHGKISLWHDANSMPENCNYPSVIVGNSISDFSSICETACGIHGKVNL